MVIVIIIIIILASATGGSAAECLSRDVVHAMPSKFRASRRRPRSSNRWPLRHAAKMFSRVVVNGLRSRTHEDHRFGLLVA